MSQWHQRFAFVALLLVVAGCADNRERNDPIAPQMTTQPKLLPGVSVMTRNLYLGANLDAVLATRDPNQVPIVIAQTWAQIVASNFPERAHALAAEIATHRPALIGLQEATVYRRQSPSDFVQGVRSANASAVAYDFVDLLLAALAQKGLNYRVASRVVNSDLEFPMYTGTGPIPFDDIRYTDQDVILARADIQTSNPVGQNFTARLPLNVGGLPVPVLRGWTAVDVHALGQTVRFVNTHLEVQTFAPVQEAQARELIAALGASTAPVVLVGDFNSAANASAPATSKTASYGLLLDAGFIDIWARNYPNSEGLTCCHAPDLRNPVPTLNQRIDMILVRPNFGFLNAVRLDVTGDEVADRTASGLWPSDHAGVVARLGRGRR